MEIEISTYTHTHVHFYLGKTKKFFVLHYKGNTKNTVTYCGER